MGSSGQSYSSEFDRTLELYRTNLLQAKVTGNMAFKTASDNAKKWLDDYLVEQRKTVDDKKKEIEEFVRSYENSEDDLTKLKADMQEVRSKGPELQSLYETEHKTQEEEPIDLSLYYTKGAILGGVVALILVASIF
jgi:hypothetical protein